jgi:predicted carbohydrate-binding protein with CBM5 and CBM33 domain
MRLSLRKIAGGVVVSIARAHGATGSPISRTLACYLEGPESPDSPACQWAVSVGGTQPLYDWNEVSNMQAGGRHREQIPDGKLCSANRAKYDAYNAPRLDWPTSVMQAGNFTFRYAAYVPHNRGGFEVYVTNSAYDPTQPLRWSDLDLISSIQEPPLIDGYYVWDGVIPARSGRHLVYVIWQRNDSLEAFYSCSDVFFGVLPTPTPPPACTAPAWNASTVYNTGNTVSHAGFQWLAQWYTVNEEPGTTGEYGVWKQQTRCTGSGGNATASPTPTNSPVAVTVTNTRTPTRTPTPTNTQATFQPPTNTATGVPPSTVTPTRTSTPVPPTSSASGLKLHYRAADTNTGDNQIKPHFTIVNTGGTSVSLSELRIRYYFTKEGSANMAFWCDYAVRGCANLSGGFAALTPAKPNADTYLEVSFAAGAGSIAPGQTSGEIQIRLSKSDWSNFNESDDYSFDATKLSFTDWNRIALFQNGTLVWGVLP